MTKLLDETIEAARRLPPEAQDEIAELILRLTGGNGRPEPIDPAPAGCPGGLSQACRREFASAAEVETAFRRFER